MPVPLATSPGGPVNRNIVADDIGSRKLRAIRIEMPRNTNLIMPMQAVYPKEAPPGPARVAG